ncbi:MAG: magnetosome protein MamC [Desulfosarcina sp.]|nr:magnetosome protein MamC [Desulfosarcina sp.]
MGAIIGGTAAAAKNIRRVKDAEINREEAVRNTIKEAAGAGLATAAATAVVGAVGATGLLSLVGILAMATGTKYLWDATTAPEKAPAAAPKEAKPKKETKSKP